jgi:hypothetical protein
VRPHDLIYAAGRGRECTRHDQWKCPPVLGDEGFIAPPVGIARRLHEALRGLLPDEPQTEATQEVASADTVSVPTNTAQAPAADEVMPQQPPGRAAWTAVDEHDVLRTVRLIASPHQFVIDNGILPGPQILGEPPHGKECRAAVGAACGSRAQFGRGPARKRRGVVEKVRGPPGPGPRAIHHCAGDHGVAEIMRTQPCGQTSRRQFDVGARKRNVLAASQP